MNKKVINLMFLLPSLNSGGVERFVVKLSNYLVQHDFQIYILTSEAKMKNLLHNKIHLIYTNINSKNVFKIILNSIKVKYFCAKYKIDILYPQSRVQTWCCSFARLNKNIKLITIFHGMYSCNTFLKFLYSKIMLSGNIVISVSEFITNYILLNYKIKNILPNNNIVLSNNNKKKLITIINGVNIEKFSPYNITKGRIIEAAKKIDISDESKKILLFPGRISEIKGQMFLLETLKMMKKRDFVCVILGDIEKKAKLTKEIFNKIGEYQLEDCVKVINDIQDIQPIYLLSHVVLSLSNQPEAFGLIPVEAAAMARPSIVTNIGGFKHTVIHKKTGWVVESGNSEQLIEAIEEALSVSSEKWKEMGLCARDFVTKNFSTEKSLEYHKDILLSL